MGLRSQSDVHVIHTVTRELVRIGATGGVPGQEESAVLATAAADAVVRGDDGGGVGVGEAEIACLGERVRKGKGRGMKMVNSIGYLVSCWS